MDIEMAAALTPATEGGKGDAALAVGRIAADAGASLSIVPAAADGPGPGDDDDDDDESSGGGGDGGNIDPDDDDGYDDDEDDDDEEPLQVGPRV